VRSVVFSPDGAKIISGSDDKTLCIWDAATGAPIRGALEGHTSEIKSVLFSVDGCKIYSREVRGHCIIWDVLTLVDMGWSHRAIDLESQFGCGCGDLHIFLLESGWVTGLGGEKFWWMPTAN
jgi:WD40 repeat protein